MVTNIRKLTKYWTVWCTQKTQYNKIYASRKAGGNEAWLEEESMRENNVAIYSS